MLRCDLKQRTRKAALCARCLARVGGLAAATSSAGMRHPSSGECAPSPSPHLPQRRAQSVRCPQTSTRDQTHTHAPVRSLAISVDAWFCRLEDYCGLAHTRTSKTRCAPRFNTWCALCGRPAPSGCSSTNSAQVFVGGEFWEVCLVPEFSFSNAVSAWSLRFITRGRRKMAHHISQQGTVQVWRFGAQDLGLQLDPAHLLSTDDLGNLSLVVW